MKRREPTKLDKLVEDIQAGRVQSVKECAAAIEIETEKALLNRLEVGKYGFTIKVNNYPPAAQRQACDLLNKKHTRLMFVYQPSTQRSEPYIKVSETTA